MFIDKAYRGRGLQRDRRDDIEPAESRKPCGDFLAERKRQVAFAPPGAVGEKRQHANAQAIAAEAWSFSAVLLLRRRSCQIVPSIDGVELPVWRSRLFPL